MQIEITQQYVTYQSQTQLVTLAQQVATSRSKTKPAIKDAIQLGTQIRLGLEALNYSAFLTKAQIDEILYLLSDIASINAIPFAPVVTSAQPPTILVGIQGPQGDQGQTGLTGGGIAFSASNVTVDTVIDSFPITLTGSVEWIYEVFDSTNKRIERMTATWLPDGSQFRDDGGVTLDPEIGTTQGKISFFVNIAAGIVQLVAHVVTGTWTINGSRVLIPVTGNGITQPTSLADDNIWIGSSTNLPSPHPVTGDISLSNTGVSAIVSGVIVNSDINSSAAIAVSKLAPLTASKAVVTNGSGFLTTSTTGATQIGYLSNVTSDVQAQIDAIASAGAITGAITPFVTANASPSLVIVSNPAGKLTVGAATATQVGYLSNVTSDVQTQINSKANISDAPTPGSWITISLINGWSAPGADVPQYRIWTNGKVEFRGRVDATSAVNQTICAAIPALIPKGSGGVATPRAFAVAIAGSTTGNLFTVSSSGVLTLTGNGLPFVNDITQASYYTI